MGKLYVYTRVSTCKQDFERQMTEIKSYFAANGIEMSQIEDIVQEHVSGGTSYNDRLLRNLIDKCGDGDTIFTASTDRLGRNFTDMISLMAEAGKKRIRITACNFPSLNLCDNDMATRIILSVLTIMDEDEKRRIQSRAKSTAEYHRQLVKEQGGWVSKSGRWVTHHGNDKGYDMSYQNLCASAKHRTMKDAWKEKSVGYQWVKMKVLAGWPSKQILDEFNSMARLDPKNYCTRSGRPLSGGVLSKWRSEIINCNEVEG